MPKSGVRPPNGPSTTGKPSGGGRGNNTPRPKGKYYLRSEKSDLFHSRLYKLLR